MHRSSTLTPADVTTQHGIRVTSPARTVLDIAPTLTDTALTRAVNDARLAGYLQFGALAELLARSTGAPGAARLELLISGDAPTRSQFEDAFKRFLRRFGLPTPLMNVQVEGYEVDAWFPRERLIVELDGYRYHQDRGAFERDPQARRDVACRRPGYGPRDLGSDDPGAQPGGRAAARHPRCPSPLGSHAGQKSDSPHRWKSPQIEGMPALQAKRELKERRGFQEPLAKARARSSLRPTGCC